MTPVPSETAIAPEPKPAPSSAGVPADAPSPERAATNAPAPMEQASRDELAEAVAAALRTKAGSVRVETTGEGRKGVFVELAEPLIQRLQPAAPSPTEPSRNNQPLLRSSTPRKPKVLVVEDDVVSRQLMRLVLSRESRYEVTDAANGRIAWELLDQGLTPDACILDICMPEVDGLQLLERMRGDARFKKIPTILCTAVKDRETVVRAAPLQVSYYLLKPFSSEAVLTQLSKVLS